ncbi:MAG: hypothetical protein CVV24_06740 [Ignavibacteriae bacterium HGW-Ignavibacteriae-3]|nr:MAG: hypothetical protein CVV24_06740 [Ignavibacteriae bacterium HGW-Ignavibacteriae-3]
MFDPNGTNNMWQGGGCGGQMNFNSMGSFQFHFDDKQVQAYGGDKNNMKVKYWDNQSNKWIVISNAVVNKTNNTVTFSSNQVSNYFILTSNSVTGVESNNNEIPVGYYLEQNYPNPFNPTTNISYSLPLAGNVVLKIYDIMGQEVKTLVSGFKEAGHYQITLDAGSFSSGVYLYRLQIGTFMTTKKFILMK